MRPSAKTAPFPALLLSWDDGEPDFERYWREAGFDFHDDPGFWERWEVRRKLDDTSDPTPEPSTREHDPNALLTMTQAAARLGITIEQLKAHVADGALRFINVGRGSK